MTIEKKALEATDGTKPKRTMVRSPNYPAFSLEEAISRARILWEKDHKAGSSLESALQHLGFKADSSPSGPAARSLATLKKFGLTEERSGRIFLSQSALDIIIYPETDERNRKAIHESALKPSIYTKLYNKHVNGLPSDETLRSELIREDGFNPKQVDGFLADFKKTIEFSGLQFVSDTRTEDMVEQQVMRVDQSGQATTIRPSTGIVATPTSPAHANSFPIPLRRQNQAVIGFSRLPLDKSDLDLLKNWIDLMAENLIEPQTDQSS